MKAQVQDPAATVCEGCSRIPLSHLRLDLDEPVGGWLAFFAERGVEVVEDDLGRPGVGREVLGALLAEREEEKARVATKRAELAAAREDHIPAGVPALEGATAFESLVAASGVVTPQQEFGRHPKPNFLDDELAAGQRQAAERRAEAELLKKAQRILDGRDK